MREVMHLSGLRLRVQGLEFRVPEGWNGMFRGYVGLCRVMEKDMGTAICGLR